MQNSNVQCNGALQMRYDSLLMDSCMQVKAKQPVELRSNMISYVATVVIHSVYRRRR